MHDVVSLLEEVRDHLYELWAQPLHGGMTTPQEVFSQRREQTAGGVALGRDTNRDTLKVLQNHVAHKLKRSLGAYLLHKWPVLAARGAIDTATIVLEKQGRPGHRFQIVLRADPDEPTVSLLLHQYKRGRLVRLGGGRNIARPSTLSKHISRIVQAVE